MFDMNALKMEPAMTNMGSAHHHRHKHAYKLQKLKQQQQQQQHTANGAKVNSSNNVSAKVTDYRKVIIQKKKHWILRIK